ncbi:APC family permease [Paraflavisolibacter sp. H34]|uniref:APC family permease n=1 Tax=Huijunlia imazamoxiresistens TaxID=3127457 RepID=UPI00301A3620
MKKGKELFFYVTVCAGTALSTSSFAVMAGMFEVIGGAWVLLCTLLAGLFCIAISDSVSELASRYPSAPGIRTFFKNAFTGKTSLFFTYFYFLFIVIIGAVECNMFSLVFRELFPGAHAFAVITLLLFSVLLFNLAGMELPRNLQIVSTSAVLAVMLAVGLAGVYLGWQRLPQLLAGLSGAGQWKGAPVTLGMALFLFVGFEWVTPLGWSREAYKKLIPLSMPLGITLNLVVYVLFILGLSLILPQKTIAAGVSPHVPYVVALFGQAGRWLAMIISAFAIISTFNSGIMGGSRLVYALGREGSLPKILTRISGSGIPYVAILLLGVSVYAAALYVSAYELVLESAAAGSAIICFIYAALVYSGRVIGQRPGQKPASYQPKFPWKFKVGLIVFLCVIGFLTLFSLPQGIVPTTLLFGLSVLLALALAALFNGEKAPRRPMPQASGNLLN